MEKNWWRGFLKKEKAVWGFSLLQCLLPKFSFLSEAPWPLLVAGSPGN